MSGFRLDVAGLYGLLDVQRRERGLSWNQLAKSVGTTSSAFTRMSKGRSPDAHLLVALVLWLGWAPELALVARRASETS